jgi:hypothetical protein
VSLSQITIKNRAKNIAWIFIPVIFLAIFFAPKITNAQSTSCSKWPRDISCYKTLWGTKFDWTRDQIKTANGNGIIYLGPVKESLDSDGLPKKLLTTISLSVDNDKFRALNMIGSTYVKDDLINVRYKFYLRYLEDAFIVRIYQEDSSGKQVNVSLSPVAVSPFPDVKDSIRGSIYMPNGKSVANTLNEGKAVDRLIRFRSGSGAFSNISNIYEDGYTQNSTDSSLSNPVYTGAAGAAIGSVVPGIGTVIGGVVGAVVGALNTSGPTLVLRQTALITIELESGVKLDKNLPTYMELWYAGEDREDTSDTDVRPAGHELNQIPLENLNTPEEGDTNDPRIRYFKKSWIDYKELPYFQIGPRQTIDLPKNLADAETQANNAIAESGDVNSNLGTNATQSTLPECSIDPISNGSVMGCVAQIVYHGVFRPIAAFAQLMGYIFDFFIGYSLSDESYRHDFIQTGWQLVRDISNIFFIIIMIYSGLAAVFSTSNTSYKKVIPALIVNALIINFSLFATRIVIDMSNITARIFYNQMIVKIDGKEQSGEDSTTGYKPISEAIVSSFNPQSIFKNKVLTEEEPLQKDGSSNSSTSGVVFNGSSDPIEGKKFRVTSSEYAGYFTLVTLAAIAISFFMAMMFWKTAFMFVGRVIGLYVAMIFSPFAFLSRGNIPLVNKVGSLSFSSWWGNLSKYALLAPIFVFFLYIINAFLNVEFFTKIGLDQQTSGLTGTSSFFVSVMYVVIPMLIIYGLVSWGVKIAESLAGEYAQMAQKLATGATGMVVGGALGVASGGLAYAGTRFGSRIGRALGQTSLGRRAAISVGRAASNGTRASLAARLTNRALNWTQNSSWDARNTRLGGLVRNNPIVNQMGLRPSDRVSGAIGLGQRDFEGGYIAQQERRQKELREEIENIKFTYLNDEQSKKLWKEISDAKVGNDAMKDYLNKTDTSFKASSDKETTLKKEVKDAQKKIDGLEADLKTNNKLSDSEMKAAKDSLKTEKENLANKQKEITDIQKLQLQTIENIASDKTKTNKIRETKEYQDSYKDKVNELQKTYGKIESSKDLTNAMRRDYAETLRNDSFWMKDGKQRSWVWTQGGALGGTLGAMISGGASAAFGAIASESIRFEQEALDAVTKKYIKDYGKGKGKTSKIDQYKNQLDELNKKLKEVVAAKKGISVDDVNLDDHDLKDQREWVKEHVENLKAEFDARDAEFKDATDAYRRSAKTAADKDAYASASKARKRAEDMAKAAENLWKNKSETEEKIKKEEDQDKK